MGSETIAKKERIVNTILDITIKDYLKNIKPKLDTIMEVEFNKRNQYK